MHITLLMGIMFVSLGSHKQNEKHMDTTQKAILGSGCFWCTEAVYERLDGVISVMPGYAGGTTPNPTYDEVCTGKTGYAEVAEITFDPSKISYEKILDVFWKCHEPTSLNRQGADVGTQYRSVIFYSTDEQQKIAEKSRAEAQKMFSEPIVTQIVPLTKFYEAENYHREYYDHHPDAPYCRFVIKPKLDKLHLK
jgi:peptide-methionine (S)-S-oxide reductase